METRSAHYRFPSLYTELRILINQLLYCTVTHHRFMIQYMHDVRVRASVGGSAGRKDRLGRRGRSCPSSTLQAGLEHSQIIRLHQQREGTTSETCKKTRSCLVFASPTPRPTRPTSVSQRCSKPNTIPYVLLSASLTVSISQ
jgi:hypothetical protein